MTLNLMLTSRPGAFLSGDFRLSAVDPHGRPTGRVRDDPRSQKLIPVIRVGWSALVSFTGVALTDQGGSVGDWIAEQTHGIPMDAHFGELPRALLSADGWLAKVGTYRLLTFSVVAFVGRRPYAMIISNCEDLDGTIFDPPLPKLRQFEHRPKIPDVRVAGDRNAVHREEIKALKKGLGTVRDPREMHSALAKVNAAAAERSEVISRGCVTGHLTPSGVAEVFPHGIQEGVEYMPGFVERHLRSTGVDGLQLRLDEDGKPLPPRWLGLTARVYRPERDKWAVGVMHRFRNVDKVVSDGTPSAFQSYEHIVGPD